MFYRTQLKSIGTGGAVDMQGRQLAFIGYLPCKAGDWIYTDGAVIFGNSKPKSAPAIFDVEQSGIPILIDSDSSDEEEIRGYFTTRGKFKEYKIAQDDWIVNSKKNFKHGEKEFNGARVIDAEVTDDGDEFIVNDGFFRKCQAVKYHNHLYNIVMRTATERNGAGVITFTSDHKFVYEIAPIVGQEITLGADAENINIPVTIYKNDEIFLEIPLETYTERAIQECWLCNDELLSHSADITTSINFIQQPPPPSDSFIALSYARVESFRVDQEGNWDALISAAAYGHCFLYILLNGSLFHLLFADATLRSFSKSLDLGLETFESTIFTEHKYPFLSFEQYPEFSGTKNAGKEDILNRYLSNDPDRKIYLPIWIHLYDDDNLSDFCDDGFYRFNLSCTKTEKGFTLFGFHGEELQDAHGYAPKRLKSFHLKNFRLRELKKISKAKK